MRNAAVKTLLLRSWEKTFKILFKPFSLKKWLLLLLIAWLAGVTSAGHGGGNAGRERENSTEQTQAQSVPADFASGEMDPPAAAPTPRGKVTAGWIAFAAALTVLVIAVTVFFLWLQGRFKFIWLEAVLHDSTQMKRPFREYAREGGSLFRFLLAYTGIIFAAVLLWAGLLIFTAGSSGLLGDDGHLNGGKILTLFLPHAALFLLAFFLAAVIMAVIDDFVVPIMMAERKPFGPAWRRFLEIYKLNAGDIWLYLLIRFGLGLVTGMTALVLLIPVILAGALAALILFGVPYLIFTVALKMKFIFGLFSVLLGIPYLCAFVLAMGLVSVPFAVFYRLFSIHYLASLERGPALLSD